MERRHPKRKPEVNDGAEHSQFKRSRKCKTNFFFSFLGISLILKVGQLKSPLKLKLSGCSEFWNKYFCVFFLPEPRSAGRTTLIRLYDAFRKFWTLSKIPNRHWPLPTKDIDTGLPFFLLQSSLLMKQVSKWRAFPEFKFKFWIVLNLWERKIERLKDLYR